MQEKMLQVRAGVRNMRFLKLLTFYWLAKLGLHNSLKFSQCLKVWFHMSADLMTFTEEILNRKHFFCAVNFMMLSHPKNIK